MSSKPLLSIVIPTRNRQFYAESVINEVLNIKTEEIELIVQDNSDNNELELFVRSKDDPRIKYRYDKGAISSSDNFKRAIELARGEYVCAIGDDDNISPEVLKLCRWAKKHGVDAIFDEMGSHVQYHWPDYRSIRPGLKRGAQMIIYSYCGRKKVESPQRQLFRLAHMAGLRLRRLPRVYLGIVKKACLDLAVGRINSHPIGTCPDMFYAVAVACVARSVCVTDYPFIIPGISKPSTASAVAMGRHEGNIEHAPHLRARENYNWPPLIPRFYSVETFWAESALSALVALGEYDIISVFNFPLLYIICALTHPKRLNAIARSVIYWIKQLNTHNFVTNLQRVFAVPLGLFYLVDDPLRRRIGRERLRPIYVNNEVMNSQEAVHILEEYLNKRTTGPNGYNYD